MNSENTKLIEQLAERLGTTAEYLWTVLLSQAQVYAITTSIEIIGAIIIGVILIHYHKKFSQEKDGNSLYKEYDLGLPIIMGVFTIFWLAIAIAGFFCISNIITAIVNPEYWALDKLMDTIK